MPPNVVELLKQFPFEKGCGTASQINLRLKSLNPELTPIASDTESLTWVEAIMWILPMSRPCLATGFRSVRCLTFMDMDMTQRF